MPTGVNIHVPIPLIQVLTVNQTFVPTNVLVGQLRLKNLPRTLAIGIKHIQAAAAMNPDYLRIKEY